MIAITILIAVLLGGINIINARLTIHQTENMLYALIQQEQEFGGFLPGKESLPNGFFNPPPTENDRQTALFFIATLDFSGNIIQIETNNLTSLSKEDAVSIVEKAVQQGTSQGKVDLFRYATAIDNNEMTYIFIDTSADRQDVLQVAALSLIAGIFCWAAMLLLVVMLSRKAIRPIAANMERQKQFVTDAGHEIKTPLAIILANTEAMELHQGKSKWSQNIRQQTLRLNDLMQNLLTLSKAEENRIPIDQQTFSYSEITRETWEMFYESMALKDLKLNIQIEENIDLRGNKDQISRLISILADNAVKYAPPQSEIIVTLNKTEKHILLQTENRCEILPSCSPDKLFDRFYRTDLARTQQQNGGYGIGLSAAKAITELHRGEISARYPTEHSILFTVKLPV